MTMTNEKDILKEKFDFYLEEEKKVHIKLLNGNFRNGILIEKEREGVYILKERVFGLIHLFISEIKSIEEYKGEKWKIS